LDKSPDSGTSAQPMFGAWTDACSAGPDTSGGSPRAWMPSRPGR
jgi:hypothetical protein